MKEEFVRSDAGHSRRALRGADGACDHCSVLPQSANLSRSAATLKTEKSLKLVPKPVMKVPVRAKY